MMEIYEQHQLGVGTGHRGDRAREALQPAAAGAAG
jgi:hypothetical protein